MSEKLLTDSDAEIIRVQYWRVKRTQKNLAKRFGVSASCIHKIVFGLTYQSAGGPTSNQDFTTRNNGGTYFERIFARP